MKNLDGKVAVVTGGASGIGRAVATRFAEAGMRVVLADIQEDALDRAASELAAAGHQVIGVRTDVSVGESVEALAANSDGRVRCRARSPQQRRCRRRRLHLDS